MIRPSAAGPMLAALLSQPQQSSLVSSVFMCRMPPTDTTFFAHACGREACDASLD